VAGPEFMMFNHQGTATNLVNQLTISSKKLRKFQQTKPLTQILAKYYKWLKTNLDQAVIFVDLTADKKDLLEFHKNVIDNLNYSIITANKNPVSLYTVSDFILLTNFNHHYDFNVIIMGGAGIVHFINERKEVQNKINSIKGCFSETLGYILLELKKEKKFF